jgi:hypothetical protein
MDDNIDENQLVLMKIDKTFTEFGQLQFKKFKLKNKIEKSSDKLFFIQNLNFK